MAEKVLMDDDKVRSAGPRSSHLRLSRIWESSLRALSCPEQARGRERKVERREGGRDGGSTVGRCGQWGMGQSREMLSYVLTGRCGVAEPLDQLPSRSNKILAKSLRKDSELDRHGARKWLAAPRKPAPAGVQSQLPLYLAYPFFLA